MKPKDRIITALNKSIPDRVPTFELLIDEASILKIADLLYKESFQTKNYKFNSKSNKTIKTKFGQESEQTLKKTCFIAEKLDLDSITAYVSSGIKNINENIVKDRFGVKYRLSEHGQPVVLDGPINDIKDTSFFDMTKKIKKSDFFGPEYIINRIGKDRAVFLLISDPFKLSWKLRGGMEKLLMDYVLSPQLIHKLQAITTEYNLSLIDYAVNIGIDAIAVEGDLAGNDALLFSPSHFNEYIKPYLKKIVDFAHQKKLKIIKHSDGNIWSILDDIVEIGFDGIHPIQPQCMDISHVKEYLLGRACIIGNIDCEELLPFGSPSEVKQKVKETIELAAYQGGYILSSSNSIHPGVKPENFVAMIEAVHEFGWYKFS